ncbi:MAG: hypothetical protein GX351_11060 [Peptococcaceae bacterium]|jgi:hypothetical protein|nr:hypothetical protein [Peptococcaceae bacterium]
MNIGPRTLKSGIAVAISVYICMYFHIEPPLFAATSAVVCLQQSLGKSLRNALEQFIVNLAAIGVGIILGLTVPVLFLSMALATVIVILFCTKVFKAKNQIVLAIISAIFVLASPQDQFLEQAVSRSLAIMIGIVTANVINFTIAPPHYEKKLVDKLIELNNMAVQGFTDSVNRYLHLNTPQPEELEKVNKDFYNLFRETEKLLRLYRDQWELSLPIWHKSTEDKETTEHFYMEYLSYSRGLWQRAQDILYLAEERKIRRAEADDPTVSCEFNHIFEMLFNVIFNATSYNQELQKKIKGEVAQIYPEPRVWSKLNRIFNEWQEKHEPTLFYMHALNEISVITYNIRWFAKESARLLNF